MRTTIDIPDELVKEAIHWTHVKTKTMAVILGLQELINRHKLDELRSLKGKVAINFEKHAARKR